MVTLSASMRRQLDQLNSNDNRVFNAVQSSRDINNTNQGQIDAEISLLRKNLEKLKKVYAQLRDLDNHMRNNGNNNRDAIYTKMAKIRKQISILQARYAELNKQVASLGNPKDKGSSDDINYIAVNGSEPLFTEQKWGTFKGIKNNNCYSYAMNNFSADRPFKAVPGDRSGYNHDLSYDKCFPLQKRLLDDNPDSIYKEAPRNRCKEGFSKIMLFVGNRDDNSTYGDFHFFKHHNDIDYVIKKGDTIESVASFLEVNPSLVMTANNGKSKLKPGTSLFFKNFRTQDGRSVWSHKLGHATGAILNDACGKIITDPRSSCRKFSAIDYTKYCGTYCIRNAIAKSS